MSINMWHINNFKLNNKINCERLFLLISTTSTILYSIHKIACPSHSQCYSTSKQSSNQLRQQVSINNNSLEQKLQKMFDDKKQTPSLIIPKILTTFIKTQSYNKFLFYIYQYCKQFNDLIKKYSQLKQKMKTRVTDYAFFLQKEKLNLTLMEKQLSYIYASILLMNNEGGNSSKDQKEQFFFETLIYLITKIIKDLFTRQQFIPIEQQINRLFRTNRFNLIKRRHQKDALMKQFPSLKDPTNKQKFTLQTIINKLPQQISAYRKIQKINKSRTASKGEYNYTTLMGIEQVKDEEQRSPLICTWLPSRKNMLSEFSRSKYTNHLKMSSGQSNKNSRMLSKVYEQSINNEEVDS